MLDQLENIAGTLGMAFSYGQLENLIDNANKHTDGYLLHHEGYFLADLSEDGQGALEYRHRLTLNICAPSLITDDPATKRGHLADLDVQMRRVYKSLKQCGQVSGARAEAGLNLTPRNLDAIRITLTVLPNAVSLCRL